MTAKPRDYEVGWGKPPKSSQFGKGQSGNPKGRPKGAKNLKTDLEEELQQKIIVTERGRRKHVSKQRLMIKTLMAKGLAGDARSISVLLGLIARLSPTGEQVLPLDDLAAGDKVILKSYQERVRRQMKMEPNHD